MDQTKKSCEGCPDGCQCDKCKSCASDGKCCSSTSACCSTSSQCHSCAHFKNSCLLCKILKVAFIVLALLALCKIAFGGMGMYKGGMKGCDMGSAKNSQITAVSPSTK